MVLEGGVDRQADRHRLGGVAEQVAEDTDAAGIGQLHQDDDVWTGVDQGRVHRVPDPFPGEDPPGG